MAGILAHIDLEQAGIELVIVGAADNLAAIALGRHILDSPDFGDCGCRPY